MLGPGKLWVFASLLLAVVGGGFIVAALANSAWVKNNSVNGGLLRCANCKEVKDMAWVCLAGTECNTNPKSFNCGLYQNLSDASAKYFYLEVISLFFIIMGVQPIIAIVVSRRYGFKYLSHVSLI